MQFPSFIQSFPRLNVPFPDDVVTTRAIRSDRGLVVFFTFHKDFDLPPHSHLAQWGTVVAGEIVFTIGDGTRRYGPGDSYSIPPGVVHSAHISAGTCAIDVFEEPDRYGLIE